MALTTCKKCGGQISDRAPYCVHCGEPLQAQKHTCPVCHAEYTEGTNYCTSCGHRLHDSLSDSPTSSVPTSQEKTYTKTNKSSPPIWPIIALTLSIALVAGFLFYEMTLRSSRSGDVTSATPSPASETTGSMATPPVPIQAGQPEATESGLIDPTTGLFEKDIDQLCTVLGFRCAMLTDLQADVVKSVVQVEDQSTNIIALSWTDKSITPGVRASAISCLNKNGERTDGKAKHDIAQLDAIMTDDSFNTVGSVTLVVISAFEGNLINDQIKDEVKKSFDTVVLNKQDSYEFVYNNVCFNLYRDMLGNLHFSVYANK